MTGLGETRSKNIEREGRFIGRLSLVGRITQYILGRYALVSRNSRPI